MKKLLLAFFLCLCWQVKSAAAPLEATLCMDSYPPFTYFNDGEPTGAMVDALKIIAQRLNFTLHVTPNTPFARCLRMAKAGVIDLMVSLMPTEERLAYMAMFTYATEEPLRLIVLKGAHQNVNSLEQVISLKLGLVNGFLYPEVFHGASVNTVLSSSTESGIRQLRAGRVDAVLLHEAVAEFLVLHDEAAKPSEKDIELLSYAISRADNPNSIALSKKSALMPLALELEQQIEQLRNDGTFKQLIEQHRKSTSTVK